MIAHAQAVELNLLNLLSGPLIRHEGVDSVAMLAHLTEDDSTVIVTTACCYCYAEEITRNEGWEV